MVRILYVLHYTLENWAPLLRARLQIDMRWISMSQIAFTKKRAGLPRLALDAPPDRDRGLGSPIPQDAGSSTVSITWMTPFDWLTLEIVTIDEPPLASTIMT